MELRWTPLPGLAASADGSAYAEFWLEAKGSADAQRALAGVVRHIGPVLQELALSQQQKTDGSGGDEAAEAVAR